MDSKLDEQLPARAQGAYDRLLTTHGERPLTPRREPMHELISTMLSHRTTERNEAQAYDRMWERFGSWEAIRDAPAEELTQAIRPATFPEAKAPNIQETLRRIIAERGEPSIDFLSDLPAEEGLQWLMDLPGVGIKTASLVLFTCVKDVGTGETDYLRLPLGMLTFPQPDHGAWPINEDMQKRVTRLIDDWASTLDKGQDLERWKTLVAQRQKLQQWGLYET